MITCFGMVPDKASAMGPVTLWFNEQRVYVPNDSAPFVENGRTFISLRMVSECFGCQVDWIGETQDIIIRDEESSRTIRFRVGIPMINLTPDGERENQVKIDVAPMIRNNRTFVPLRVVGELFGTVTWIDSSREIHVKSERLPSIGQPTHFDEPKYGPKGQFPLDLSAYGIEDVIPEIDQSEFMVVGWPLVSGYTRNILEKDLLAILAEKPLKKKYFGEGFALSYPESWTAVQTGEVITFKDDESLRLTLETGIWQDVLTVQDFLSSFYSSYQYRTDILFQSQNLDVGVFYDNNANDGTEDWGYVYHRKGKGDYIVLYFHQPITCCQDRASRVVSDIMAENLCAQLLKP